MLKYKLAGRDGALRLSFARDEKAIQIAERKDGRYVLVTNAKLSADEMLKAFKGQCGAERRFHILKGPLTGRGDGRGGKFKKVSRGGSSSSVGVSTAQV